MQNVVGPTLVAMATKFWLGAEIQSPTGLSNRLRATIVDDRRLTPIWAAIISSTPLPWRQLLVHGMRWPLSWHKRLTDASPQSLTYRGRPNFGFGFGSECGQMDTFGGHSVSAESSRTTFGTLSVSQLELRRQRMRQTHGRESFTV